MPPGFRFRPTHKELVEFLKRKVRGSIEMEHDIITEVDICKCEPWDLPEKGLLTGRDQEWYFFRRRNKKYTNGTTIQRASEAGYWKDTGKSDEIMSSDMQPIGKRKSLTFYIGRPHRASQTEWRMHEYHLVEEECGDLPSSQDAYALCRVFKTKQSSAHDRGRTTPRTSRE